MENQCLKISDFINIFQKISSSILEHSDELCELDAVVGDGDHGTTIKRGVLAGEKAIMATSFETVDKLLSAYALAMVSSMGGAAGPIFSSLFMGMASGGNGVIEINSEQMVSMLKLGLERIVALGKAKEGDKTLVDALAPATRAAKKALDEGSSLSRILELAYLAGKEGTMNTSSMIAKKGRAQFAGERGLGHEDAGAASITLILQAFSEGAKSGATNA